MLLQGRNGIWERARTGIAKPAVEKVVGEKGQGAGREWVGLEDD